MAVPLTSGWAKLVPATAAAVVLVAADQTLRGEPALAEWWIDLPVAGLIALAGWIVLSRVGGEGEQRTVGDELERAQAIDEVVAAVNRGAPVEGIMQNLARQACRVLGVERALVMLRDEADPRTSVVAAGEGVPPGLIGLRFGIDEGMAGHVITTGKCLLVDDYHRFSRRLPHEVAHGLYAGGAAPIRRGAGVGGALAIGTTNPRRRFGERELETLDRLAEVGSVALEQAQMRRQLEKTMETGVEAMAAAVDLRDNYTGEHSDAVLKLALNVGRRMGLRGDALCELEFAARLHDVGKIGVPDAVLLKGSALDEAEWEVMRHHPEWGAKMLARMPGLKRVARIVRHAHERWDGEGYPDCLRSQEIPLESRIIFACDAYHAMTSNRPYRAALRPWVAVSELREGAGGQFDPDVVDELVGALREERSHAPHLFQHAASRAT
jgi:hypothetical protein